MSNVKKRHNSYWIGVLIDPSHFENLEVVGKFTVEVFEKNFGTFVEDVRFNMNTSCDEITLDGNPVKFESLSMEQKSAINIVVELIAMNDLKYYIEGND